MKKLILLLSILMGLSFSSFASALLKIDKTVFVKEDTYIASDTADKNYGSENLMKPKAAKSFDRMALLKFDLSETEITAMKGAQLRIAVTFGSGAEESEYAVYVFNNLKWSEKDGTYAKLSKDISLDKGEKLGDINFKKNEKNDAKYYYLNITKFLKMHKKGEFTIVIVDEKKENKNLNIRTKEHSEKWRPVIEIQN